jgi:hypothetical protein
VGRLWLALGLALAMVTATATAARADDTDKKKVEQQDKSKSSKQTNKSGKDKSGQSAAKDREKASKASGADRERARDACRAEARERDYQVVETGQVQGSGDRLSLSMQLRRDDRRYAGECSYDVRGRNASLRVRQTGGSGGSGQGSGGGGRYASSDQVRDKCVQEVSGNARTQLVSTGKIERRGDGVSAMDMVINVEGQERRVKCYFDNRTRAANIR